MLRSELFTKNLRPVRDGDGMTELLSWMKSQAGQHRCISVISGNIGFFFRSTSNLRGECQSIDVAEMGNSQPMYMLAQNNACWQEGETNMTNSHLEDLACTFLIHIKKGDYKVY